MVQRHQYYTLKKRIIDEPRRFIQVLSGPRQVGKTTITKQLIADIELPSLYASADSIIDSPEMWISQVWERARIELSTSGMSSFVLIFDEIQKINQWSTKVKAEWDRDTLKNVNIKLVILGSSSLLLQDGLNESLMGRFEMIHVGHWTFAEAKTAFGINEEQYAYYGSYPGSLPLIEDPDRWKSYMRDSIIESTIKKDVLQMAKVEKPMLMDNLFFIGVKYSGQILAYTKMIGQLHDAGNTTTLAHYLKLLQRAGLLCGLNKYSNTILRQRASSPKLQVMNTGLIGCLSDMSLEQLKMQPDKWGRCVESCIGAHLIAHMDHEKYDIMYWREGDYEVDFVLSKGDKVVAIEVKSSKLRHVAGLEKFRKIYPEAKVITIGDLMFDWKSFINMNPRILFEN
jgi:uncharacterized protein